MPREEEWGTWECPDCGEEHDDPASICVSSCRQCGLSVELSAIDDYGQRDAWKLSDDAELIVAGGVLVSVGVPGGRKAQDEDD